MSTAQLVKVWALLVAATAVEVALAFQLLTPAAFLVVLLVLSFAKAALIVAWFMHLRFETKWLSWSLFPLLIFFVALLFAFLPDAYRIR